MKLLIFILLIIKLMGFSSAISLSSLCSTPDCANTGFVMKDVTFNIGFSVGEIVSQNKSKYDLPTQTTSSSRNIPCDDTFKAVNPSNQLNTLLVLNQNVMQLSKGDSVRCKINEFGIPSVPSLTIPSFLNIHTKPDQTVFISAPQTKCFSFSVKAEKTVQIYLSNNITYNSKKIEIILGSKNNTGISYKKMETCERDVPEAVLTRFSLLNQTEFIDFWICWASNNILLLGQDNEVIIDKKEDIKVMEDLQYIGLGTTFNAATWRIHESNCPGCYQVKPREFYAGVNCFRVEDTCENTNKTYKSLLLPHNSFNLLEENQNEFHQKTNAVEISPKINYIQLRTEANNYQKLNVNRKSLCHSHAHIELEKCVCDLGWAGDGKRCERDSDYDGFPDVPIANCTDYFCRVDNCPSFPNSDQNDRDFDGFGDACDIDIDNDKIENDKDNCPYIANKGQQDYDQDGIGDVCDNCMYKKNRNQLNTDNNLDGDECDSDVDDDGIKNFKDNCPLVFNKEQLDYDKDGIGDNCDNCRTIFNPKQEDENENLIGDACDEKDHQKDKDNDGIPNKLDNCIVEPNSNQWDLDNDGKGDICDTDIDNDSIENNYDNCIYVSNIDQIDTNGNNIGDACENDFDNDLVLNKDDICPLNPYISYVNFFNFQTISLNPNDKENVEPEWIHNHENTISQIKNSKPGLLIGKDVFGSVEYNGTFYVNSITTDNDYIGFVFSYVNNKKFCTVMWKKEPISPNHHKVGLQIKLVNSLTGPGKELRNALWHHKSTKNQVEILWEDSNNLGWKPKTAYRWILRHVVDKLFITSINLSIYKGDQEIIKSKTIYGYNIYGGRLGLFTFSQGNVVWADLKYRCI